MDERRCRRCKNLKPPSEFKSDRHRKCIPCTAEAVREYQRKHRAKLRRKKKQLVHSRAWYAAHPEHYAEYVKKQRKENPQIALAYAAVENATRSGKIIRPGLCESCQRPGIIQAHHEDYFKPLDVAWLCVKCHSSLHHQIC